MKKNKNLERKYCPKCNEFYEMYWFSDKFTLQTPMYYKYVPILKYRCPNCLTLFDDMLREIK